MLQGHSFTIMDEVFMLRADRSRLPERIGPLADMETEGDPRLVLAAYRKFILGEIRYADRAKWARVEEQLELGDFLELIAWIISPWTGPISEVEVLNAKRKALEESRR